MWISLCAGCDRRADMSTQRLGLQQICIGRDKSDFDLAFDIMPLEIIKCAFCHRKCFVTFTFGMAMNILCTNHTGTFYLSQLVAISHKLLSFSFVDWFQFVFFALVFSSIKRCFEYCKIKLGTSMVDVQKKCQ